MILAGSWPHQITLPPQTSIKTVNLVQNAQSPATTMMAEMLMMMMMMMINRPHPPGQHCSGMDCPHGISSLPVLHSTPPPPTLGPFHGSELSSCTCGSSLIPSQPSTDSSQRQKPSNRVRMVIKTFPLLEHITLVEFHCQCYHLLVTELLATASPAGGMVHITTKQILENHTAGLHLDQH